MVIGPPQVDETVETPLELIDKVRKVRPEIGGLAVSPDDDPILVVPEAGRHEPLGLIPLFDVAFLLELLYDPSYLTRLVEGPLREPHVVGRPETLEGRFHP